MKNMEIERERIIFASFYREAAFNFNTSLNKLTLLTIIKSVFIYHLFKCVFMYTYISNVFDTWYSAIHERHCCIFFWSLYKLLTTAY